MVPKRENRVLTQDEINTRRRLGITLDPRVLRKEGIFLPVMGGSPDGDDDDDNSDDSSEDDNSDDDSEDDDEEKKKRTSSASGDDDESEDESEDDDKVTLSKNEVARLRRKAKERDDLEKKDKEAKKNAERKKKQEEGKWQELVDEEKENTRKETERAEKAERDLAKYKYKVNVASIAQRLGFKDPADAYRFLDEDEYLDAEEDIIESSLKKVLKNKDYLKSERRATGGPGGRGNGAGSWDINDIKKMSVDEINDNWNKPGFQDALENAGV